MSRAVVHKADDMSLAKKEGSGYGVCSSFVGVVQLTGAWHEVTCKRCLRSHNKNGEQNGNG